MTIYLVGAGHDPLLGELAARALAEASYRFFGVPAGGALEVASGAEGARVLTSAVGSVRHLGKEPFVLG